MCGLIALDRRHAGEASVNLGEVCSITGRRGPHSHGWALFSGTGWQIFHAAGPITSPPTDDWFIAIGHSRLATSGTGAGTLPPPEEAQPIIRGPIAIAHNGTLEQFAHGSRPDSHIAADSMYAQALSCIPEVFQSPTGAAQAVVAASTEGYLMALRTGYGGGHPLYRTATREGLLISSARVHDSSQLIPTGATWITPPTTSSLSPNTSGR